MTAIMIDEAVTLRFEEGEPTYPVIAAYDAKPTVYPALTEFDQPLEVPDPAEPFHHLWDRIESYVAYRWSPRQAVWTAQGAGEWTPHLAPTSNLTVDVWTDGVWSAVSPEQLPLGGFYLPSCATYKITATVGDTLDPVPALVVEAYQRLAKYVSDETAVPAGAARFSSDLAGSIVEETERNPAWLARALQHSGAADLLRRYRRL